MCGISGAITTRTGLNIRPLVERIVRDQAHRGPDAEQIREFDAGGSRIVLGHNRLSIIDPVPSSGQPMASVDGSAVIVFNGAIYNYKELRAELKAAGRSFRTASDTEVLLEAYLHWGEQAFDRFLGMFAFAIYDVNRNCVLLVRDRFGVKPLYYWCDGRTIAFASTPPVIAAHANLAPSLEYVGRGIRLKYYEDEGDTAPFDGLFAVPPSHFVEIGLSDTVMALKTRRYYNFADRVEHRTALLAGRPAAQLQEELLALLEDACSLRLRSDVPVGLSVSGGLDSSSIAAMTTGLGARLHGFSFGRPDEAWSEGPLVAELAATTSMAVSYVWPTGRDELERLFRLTLEAQGAPFPHSSQMAQFAVFELARQERVKVLLGGQGGDEAFMGYRKFFLFALQEILRSRRMRELPAFATNALVLLPAVLKRAGLFWSERHRYSGRTSGMGSRLRLPPLSGSDSPIMAKGQSLRQRQILDITRFSLPSLLRYEDRNSMANSIESRLPFLDHRILEFGVAVPTTEKLRNGYGKHILRATLKGRLPDSIRLSRDKRGFDTRQAEWIRSGLGALIRRMLHEEGSVVGEFLGADQSIDEAFSDQQLANTSQAFKEAVSLIWIAKPYGAQLAHAPLRLAS